MKKLVFLVVLVLMFWSFSFSVVKIGIDGGYTSVDMKKVNDEIAKAEKFTKFGNGIYGDLKLELGIMPFLNIGPKVGIIYAFPASMESSALSMTMKSNINAMLIPIMGGISASIGIPGAPFSINGGIYGGYGIAIVTTGSEMGNLRYDVPADGSGFVGDIKAGLEFSMIPFVSGTINLGYRIANIEKLKVAKDVVVSNITVAEKGEVLEDSNGNPLPFDYSGFIAGIGIAIGF